MSRKGTTRLHAVLLYLCLVSNLGNGAVFAQTTTPQQLPSVDEPAETAKEGSLEVDDKPLSDLSKRLPMGTLHIGNRSATIPDWQIVSFDSFPLFPADGQWGDIEWSKGDRIADVLTLGDFQGSLDLHLLTLASIGEGLGISAKIDKRSPIYQLKLSEFRLLERQTIGSLAEAVPALLDIPIEKLEILQDLVASVEPTVVLKDQTLEEVLEEYREIGSIKLSGLILADYTVADLPGVEIVPFQAFAQWEEAAISEVPWLPVMSWWLFPQKPQLDGEIVVANVDPEAFGSSTNSDQTYSLVLTPRSAFEPTKWTVGQEKSALAPVLGEKAHINDGSEFEGAFPFGPVFKMVPESVTPDGIHMAMYFRTCRPTVGSADCSAYGIGPIPLRTYRPGEMVFLGQYTFPVTSLPTAEPVVPELSSESSSELFEVVVDAASEHQGSVRKAFIIFSLLGGGLWWLWTGAPIRFFALVFRWVLSLQLLQLYQAGKTQVQATPVEDESHEG